MPVLEVSHLRKAYSEVVAVSDVSFSVRRNEIVGLLGPNGAGKTTTINMLLGVLEPSAGSIRIDGLDLAEHRSQCLSRTNFAAVYASLPGNLSVHENLTIFAMLYDVPGAKARIEALLETYDLTRFADTKTGLLSSGEQTRVGLAKAMLNAPKLLLLDEPTASLDPSVAQTVRERIRQHVRSHECGILWTSHNMHEVAAVCDRVLFLSRGKLLLEGDPKTLPQEHGKKDLEELFISIAREPLKMDIEQ
jgi:ABC-2 type transport system ATP-binding protein